MRLLLSLNLSIILYSILIDFVSSLSSGTGFGKPLRSANSTPKIKKGSKGQQEKRNKGYTYVKSDQEALLNQLATTSSYSPIGQAVAQSIQDGIEIDPFWEVMPSLIQSKFPLVKYDELHRIAGFIRYSLNPNLEKEESLVVDPWRPHHELHAYMPGLGATKPFYDTSQFELCRKLSDNIDVITNEYEALVRDMNDKRKNRFQSVTSMNYSAGWKTLVLFYNGHRIENFPYNLCPVTTQILESVPLAGRIAGFNRQLPNSGIPLHSDGNNMFDLSVAPKWLTCQLGIKIPEGNKASIRVGPETNYWKRGECLVYDTTYEHETFNGHSSEERIVLHVDFFNILAMTPTEIEIMRKSYRYRYRKTAIDPWEKENDCC